MPPTHGDGFPDVIFTCPNALAAELTGPTVMLRCHEQALAAVDAIARSPQEGALLILGAPGAGRSTVLAQSLAAHTDIASLVPVNPAENGWPLSGVSAILAGIGDPRVAEFTGRFALRSDDEAAISEAATELLAVLRGLGLPRTLLLVDDIDAMDAASRRVIGYMAGHLAGSGIRLVASAADIPSDEPLVGVQSVQLLPVDDTDARAVAPAGIDPGTLRILSSVAGGNLRTLVSLFDSLSPEQLHGREGLRLPPRPGRAAWHALERLTRRMGASHVAVLDRLATAPLHPRASVGSWGDDAEDALQELIDLGAVREAGAFVTLADPLVRSALADGLPSRARRELHLELRAGSGPLLDAWHASWADPAADLRAPLLEAAAESARLGHPHATIEFADRAVRSGGDGLAGALATVADELLAAGEPELAERYLQLAASDPSADVDDRLRVAISRLRADYLAGRPPHTDALLADADPELVARWAATLAAVSAARGDFHAARGPLMGLESGLAPGTTSETRSMARTARALLGSVDGIPHASDDARDPLLIALHARAETLAGDYARARQLISRLAHSLARPSRMWAGWLTALAIDCAAREGRIGQAFELASDWETQHPGVEGPAGMVPLGAWARLAAGDLEGAEAVAAPCTENAAARVGPLPTARALLFRAEIARLRGDLATASELLQVADTVAAAIDDPRLTRHLPELVEVLVETGRMSAAREVAHRFAEAARAHQSRWSTLASARTVVVTAHDEDLRERYLWAVSLHRPGDSVFELGRLHRAYGRRLAAAGAVPESEEAAADARIAFAGAGARPWMAAPTPSASAATLTPEPDAPHPPARLALLSDDERAVAELVVRGLHNKEIAAALFLSVRTVELRLTRIYRKVGARSRAHLVSLLS
ncbi:hypothetical protein H4J02_03145 [Protaetiibacter sp. SSC-01]|uniref:LuxR C-terminal-related transcriptional regulator n=1 Tax=Protaetiibacter sp. SSC-01 TaxID=2759943 RepID=UPI00165691D5|nr:LuxR C-terminal-related transcriptional regulator [Protaetiibacter sp. SSC-01]QNO38040.1 hypothetical protein H4J02_03145 [Protaetiibacter sp. SSC-01]